MRPKSNPVQESTTFLSLIMILLGIVLILIGQLYLHDDLWVKVFDSMGVLITGVFATSLLYEKFLAEKHFKEFRRVLDDQLRSLDTIEAKCRKLGIQDIFETRNDYQSTIPMSKVIDLAEKDSACYCVAKSLFHFLNKGAELKAGLKKGMHFRLAVVDPDTPTAEIQKMMDVYPGDIGSALNALDSLLTWAQAEEYTGSLELRYHSLYLADSCMILKTPTGHLVFWDLSFGRDLSEKKLILLHDGVQADTPQSGSLAHNLSKRYIGIYNQSVPMFKIEAGKITLNKLGDRFSWLGNERNVTNIAPNAQR